MEYTPYDGETWLVLIRVASLLLHWPLVILGLCGCLLLWLRRDWLQLHELPLESAVLVSVVVAYAIVIHMVAAPFPRYGVPFRPLLFALAMLPLRAAIVHWKIGRDGKSA